MGNTVLQSVARPFRRTPHCTDPVVGNILSGWRYDISGLSEAMRTDYDQHLAECAYCQRRQRVARSMEVLLISVSTLSMAAFLLAALVIHRVEMVTHIGTFHVRLMQEHFVAISLEAVAIAGLVVSTLLWILVAIATPLPALAREVVQRVLPDHVLQEIRQRIN
ncbi:MAG: hypothetical protein KGK08_08275 [Acidobacteriota bacterium]|nr:hypothetical protein [Acidobacteriota bacterium]